MAVVMVLVVHLQLHPVHSIPHSTQHVILQNAAKQIHKDKVESRVIERGCAPPAKRKRKTTTKLRREMLTKTKWELWRKSETMRIKTISNDDLEHASFCIWVLGALRKPVLSP
jgi:hypothetical protein